MNALNTFRGRRDYILAADIMDFILQKFSTDYIVSSCSLTCMRKAKNPVQVVPFSAESVGEAHARYQDCRQDLLVMPAPSSKETRVSCNEAFLRTLFLIENRTVIVPSSVHESASGSRATVAAFKHLLNQAEFLGSGAKFTVAALKYVSLFTAPFTVTYSRLVGGSFYEGDIIKEGASVGKVYFAQEKP